MKQPFGQTLTYMRDLLASWSSVQSITGTATTAAAKALIFHWAAPPVATTPPPRLILDAGSLDEQLANTSNFSGTLGAEIRFEVPIPDLHKATEHDQKAWFMVNVVDLFLDDMTDQLGTGGMLNVVNRSFTLPPGPADTRTLPPELGNMALWVWQLKLSILT